MSADRQDLGRAGEDYAERFLAERGWTVLARRFRSGHRDLDLVVRRGSTVAFVEVKTRRGSLFGTPVEAVGWRKQRELVRSAQVWIDRFGLKGVEGGGRVEAYRFDVVGVLVEGERVQISHVENAFTVPFRH
jgi:putative endonuclease